jgi:hypothetical protein
MSISATGSSRPAMQRANDFLDDNRSLPATKNEVRSRSLCLRTTCSMMKGVILSFLMYLSNAYCTILSLSQTVFLRDGCCFIAQIVVPHFLVPVTGRLLDSKILTTYRY